MDNTVTQGYIHEQNVMVAMRDGVRLATDIFRPQQEGSWPVLLTRVPYNKSVQMREDKEKYLFVEMNMSVERAVQADYIVVAQDLRGCFASEGSFVPFQSEAEDGVDTIAWLTQQPWCNGKIGMFGVSYQGQTQWQAASAQPQNLHAIAPCQAPVKRLIPFEGGAFLLSIAMGWTLTHDIAGNMQQRISTGTLTQEYVQEIMSKMQNIDQFYAHMPLTEVPISRTEAPYYFEWLEHPAHDSDYWQYAETDEVQALTRVPALLIGGWYDYFAQHTLRQYQVIKQRGGSEQARSQSKVIIGPWSHGNFSATYAERDYSATGSAGAADLVGQQLRWFDHWLKGYENTIEQEKPVRLFIMGVDQWRDEEAWPLPDTEYRQLYLHSNGEANSASGNGLLTWEQPGDEPEDVYDYDPHNPVVGTGNMHYSMVEVKALDQRKVEGRADVLCYTTPPLEKAIEVTGPIELVLSVSSSAPDTDFTGRLVDIYPDGRALTLTDGIVRARYRKGLSTPELLTPGNIYELHIQLGATANVFQVGHSIRLDVSSSNFPSFDRNTNTGGDTIKEGEADYKIATNRVYHSAEHPSYLILPVIEREND